MPRTALADIPSLPLADWRAACWADIRQCDELLLHLGELKDHGDNPQGWSVPHILDEARYCLEFYSDGCAADECEAGSVQALRERRQLRWFCAKWSKLWAQRQAWLVAKKQQNSD